MGRKDEGKYQREPFEIPTSTPVPGENRHRPSVLSWFGEDDYFECECLWNWGDGPESIDGSPREMYWHRKVRPLNRMQDRADYVLEFDARRARQKNVNAFTQHYGLQQSESIDWPLRTENICNILSEPAPDNQDRLDKFLGDILFFIQNASRATWQSFLASGLNLHDDYIPILPWFRLRQSRQPLARPNKGLVPHLTREWAHRLIGSELVMRVLADNFADRQEILAFLNEVKQRHYSWHDDLANAFSLGAATLRSLEYPPFHVTITMETMKRTFEARPVSKVEILNPAFAMCDWIWGHEALFAPEIVHYRFFEDDVVLPGHISLFEATIWENVDTNRRAAVSGCFGFRAPQGLFQGAVLEDLFRILQALALSRGARGFYVTRGSYWKQASDVPLQSLPRATEAPSVLLSADPVLEHANARIGSPVMYFGQQAFEFPAVNPNQPCFLRENQIEVDRFRQLPPRKPMTIVQSEDGPIGFLSDLPHKI